MKGFFDNVNHFLGQSNQYNNNNQRSNHSGSSPVEAMKRMERSIPIGHIPNFKEYVTDVLDNHPELFFVGRHFTFSGSLFSTSMHPMYLYSREQAVQLNQQLEAVANSLIRELINDHQSEYDKVLVLHDYLKRNIEYDMDALSNNSLTDVKNLEAHSIVGALLKKKCVCEGFATAMKYLCDKIGIECYVVSGHGSSSICNGPHAWNIVRINGYYHHIDVTWDNQFADDCDVPNYGYFNLSDDEIAKDHTWNRKKYPACPDAPYNYFKVNNSIIDSKVQLENFLYESFQNEEQYITFRVKKDSPLEREIHYCISGAISRASNRCKYITVSTYEYRYIDEQLTFFVTPNYRF